MRRLAAVGGFVMLLWAVACAGKRPPPATPADLQWAQRTWPAATSADLEAGRQVLVSKCGDCHRPPLPAEHAAAAWPHHLDEMAPRAEVTAEERRVLEQYLITLASNPTR
jgi:cytochrome c5